MYKDKEKQKEATREAVKRHRAKQQGITSRQGITCFDDLPADVQRTIERLSDTPEEKAQRTAIAIDYQRQHPSLYGKGLDVGKIDLPEGYKTADQLAPGEYNRVSKPGDPDYPSDKGQCHSCVFEKVGTA